MLRAKLTLSTPQKKPKVVTIMTPPLTDNKLINSQRSIDEINSRLISIEHLVKNLSISDPVRDRLPDYRKPKPETSAAAAATAFSTPSDGLPSTNAQTPAHASFEGDSSFTTQTVLAGELAGISASRSQQSMEILDALSSLKDMMNTSSVDDGLDDLWFEADEKPRGLPAMELLPPHFVISLLKRLKENESIQYIAYVVNNENALEKLCQAVYFPTEPVTLGQLTNMHGLLFFLLQECAAVDDPIMREWDVISFMRICEKNLHIGCQSYEVLAVPTLDNIKALVMGIVFAQFNSKPLLAWTLCSAAAKHLFSLGFHRERSLKGDTPQLANEKRHIFWSVYGVDKNLSLNLGRASNFPDYDIDTQYFSISENERVALWDHAAFKFIFLSKVQGQVYDKLYSATALKKSQAERHNIIASIDAELRPWLEEWRSIEESCRSIVPPDQFDLFFGPMEIIYYALQTTLHRAASMGEGTRTTEITAACFEAATAGMRSQIDEFLPKFMSRFTPNQRAAYVSWILLYTSFTPLIVVFLHAIASNSLSDVKLLHDFLDSIEPISDVSKDCRRLTEVTKVFCRVAKALVEGQQQHAHAPLALGTYSHTSNTLLLPQDHNIANLGSSGEGRYDGGSGSGGGLPAGQLPDIFMQDIDGVSGWSEESVEAMSESIALPDLGGATGKNSTEAIVVVPDADKEEKEKEKEKDSSGAYWRVFRYASLTDRLLYGLAVIMAIASGASLPIMTVVFGQFTSKFNAFASNTGPSGSAQFLRDVNSFLLYFIYLFIGRFATTFIATTCATIAATRTVRALRQAFLGHLLRMDVAHFDRSGSTATARQVTANGNKINSGIAEKLVLVVQAVSMFFAAFIVALIVQRKLALITMMSIIPATIVVANVCLVLDEKLEAVITRLYTRVSTLAQEAFGSIRAVHAFSAGDKLVERYDGYLVEAHREGDRKSSIHLVFFPFHFFFMYAGTALAFWQGYRMFRSGEIENVGTVFTIQMALMMAAAGLAQLSPYTMAISAASTAAAELFEVIDKPSQLDSLDASGDKPERCNGEIVVSNVDFAYPTRPTAQVLKNFTIRFPAGKTTALVGASGSGKSTCVGLLERWYEPLSGSITLDGKQLSEYNIKWLRSQIQLVQQEPVLFAGTVFENVARGFLDHQRTLPEAEQRQLVQDACILSNAHDFIMQLPNGYDTQVGERASRLSGGQKQRVAIARSIISNPRILLLDEATSALDPKAEKIVQDALARVSKGRTTITIAHRLSTIKKADSIAVIANSAVAEQGTHEELIALDRHYAALVRAQDLRDKAEPSTSLALDPDDEEKDDTELGLTRTRTVASKAEASKAAKKAATEGTLNYGITKCLWLLLSEQENMWGIYVVMTILCAIAAAVYPAQAILFSRIFNVFTLPHSEADTKANFYALMFFIVALATIVAYAPMGWISNTESQKMSHAYRKEMFSIALRQDMTFYDYEENSSGALAAKISSLPEQLVDMMSMNMTLMVIVVFNVVAGGMLPLIAAGYYRMRLEVALDAANGERFAASASIASEAVAAIRTVASLTLEEEVLATFSAKLGEVVTKSFETVLLRMALYSAAQSLDFLAMALGFWYGARLLARGEYDATQFFVIFIGVIFAGQAAGQFFGFTTSLSKAAEAANYIFWLRSLEPTIAVTDENKDCSPDGDDDITFNNVGFAYPQRQQNPVLRGIDITIHPSQFIALVGASGCGKTTIISLLERFYDPTHGHLLHGATPVSSFSPVLYRSHLSLVQQEPTLYAGSVRDNILLGLPTATPIPSSEIAAALGNACKMANAYDFIMSLPDGLDTSCGAYGTQFSGGQRQRIAIARALIRNPRVLLLDEATSALDTMSERLVQGAIDAARTKSGRITVAVAHRLSTVVNADVIYVFAEGRVVEQGTHGELLARRGRYYQMCLAQSLDRGV
ncbi:ABC multidrug transporter MDR5 [Drechslerella dactyloides]|uniref:ABC multidrug transporter MDR5 n=1 Tax=Drechslerella dactyloides TaxID=74499 RepID=A0AAD6J781_DREDA|nr:ABC multidrug transporter MDR5 [Drechslerella dactyloides]